MAGPCSLCEGRLSILKALMIICEWNVNEYVLLAFIMLVSVVVVGYYKKKITLMEQSRENLI